MTLPFRAVCPTVLALWAFCFLLMPPAHAAPGGPAGSLEFIQNRGQWDGRVRYEAALPAGRLYVQADALTYSFLDPAALSHHHGEPGRAAPTGPPAGDVAGHAYTVHFEHARAGVRLTAAAPTAGERNYFVGDDARRWARHVAAFGQLRYAGLWPGIDLTLYENSDRRLEYDVLLAPRANPARVALRYEGAAGLALDAAGNLVVKTTVGTTTELAPRAWQLDAPGQRRAVPCRYVLTGRTLTFALGAYDRRRALTIDPTVQFATLTNSTADNWGFTATYDNAGNLYSGGIVFNTGGAFPATPGAFRTGFSSIEDVALIKYNTAVSGAAARVWATYLGGNSSEFPHSLVANGRGELTVLGSTSSTNYPTTAGALQRTFGGGTPLNPFLVSPADPNYSNYTMPNGADLVVTRLSADGSALLASTYLGGSANDGVLTAGAALAANYGDVFRGDVLLDAATDEVLVASNTGSVNFPGLAVGPVFNPTYGGGSSDAVVCRLAPALTAVRWAGLLGGSGADAAYSVQQDARGRTFVCGGTASPNLLTTPGAYLAAAPGNTDGFVARISADGRTLERASYVGTNSYDQAQFLQLDAGGNAYLLGQTLGPFTPVSGRYGAVDGTLFVQKLDPDLTSSRYRTAFGGRGGARNGPNLVPTAFLVDECERVYLAGWGGFDNGTYLGGTTSGLPTTADALQPTTDGSDFYLAQFAPGMAGLDYGTFFGQQGGPAEHVDGGTSRFDPRGVVYQAVCASCGGTQGFPVPPGANTYSTHNGSGNCNNGAFKMTFEVRQADPGPRRFVCAGGGPVALGGSPAGGVWAGPGVGPAAGGGYQFAPGAVGPGQYVISYTVAATGLCLSTRTVRYLVAPPVVPGLAPVPPQCTSGVAVVLAGTPAGGVFSGPGVSGGRFDPAAAGVGTQVLTYTVTDSLGCGAVSRPVVVTRPPAVNPGRDTTLCADQQQPFQLRGASPAGGAWAGPGVSAGGMFTPPNTSNRGGVFRLSYAVVEGPCQATAARTVVVAPTAAQDVALNLPVCAALPEFAGLAPFTTTLAPVLIAPNASFVWEFDDGTPNSIDAQPEHRFEHAGTYRVRLTARYANCEVLTGFAPLRVGEPKIPNIITPNGDGVNDTFRPVFSCLPAALDVYSRWGKLLYRAADYHNSWDAQGLPDGVYYYLLRDTAGRRAKGWVEVVR